MSHEPSFQPFDPHGELSIYTRNMPHWRQPGVTYFVTFRQDDSIPEPVLAEWLDDRSRWYRAHGIDLSWKDRDPERFLTAYRRIPAGVRRAFERHQARMLHEELDRCHGSCGDSGVTSLGKNATTRPCRSTTYLLKFHAGSFPLRPRNA